MEKEAQGNLLSEHFGDLLSFAPHATSSAPSPSRRGRMIKPRRTNTLPTRWKGRDKFKKPSLFKRIPSFGAYRLLPQLSSAERLIQLYIPKYATALVDTRDDLETKIGRMSRRFNFLMTESDLRQDKFVTLEQYAKK